MSDPNENKPGYKETKVGWIPDEWQCTRLADISSINSKTLSEQTIPDLEFHYVDLGCICDGRFSIPDQTILFSEAPSRARRKFQEGDVLLATVRPNLKGFGFVDFDATNHVCSTGFAVVRPIESVSGKFVFLALFSNSASRYFHNCVVGTGYPALNNHDVDSLLIALPKLPEQQDIAEILFTCNELIEKTDALIKAKKRQKKALMQKLLTGQKRLLGFDGEWKTVVLDELCSRLRDVAENPNGYPVLSITARTGFVSQQDKFSRVIAGKQVEMYVLLKRGDFAYNKGNSYLYPQGCVYQLSEYDEGLVPNVFYSFRINEARAEPEFIKQYFIAGLHNKDLYRWINSGVRNNGLLNLNASDFFKLPIDLPPLAEQAAIGSVLRDADIEIKKLEDKLMLIKQQKKSLMQKLLTGQLRVKI